VTQALPYRPLAGFYFFYFAYLGAFAPFFGIYLTSLGMSPAEIGVVMASPQIARIFAPHLWGWLADAGAHRMRVVRATTLAAAACWLGMYASGGFLWICAVVLALCFFFSAALPLMEAATLTHIGEHTGRYGNIRLWGSVGYIVAVVAVGYALDVYPPRVLMEIVLACILGTLAFVWLVPEARSVPHESDAQPIADILKRPQVVALIVAGALMSMAHGPYYSFYSIHLVDHGYSKSVTGWLWALGVVCEIAVFLWLPRLYAAWPMRAILIASFGLAVLRFLMIGWGADSLALLLFAQTLHAATFGSFHAASIGIVHQLFRGRHQSRGQTIYGSLAYGVGGTIGSLASGYAWGALGPALTFSAAAACAFAGMLLIIWKLQPPVRS
jgi:PPP family 3-phenylpropionic acid transporter